MANESQGLGLNHDYTTVFSLEDLRAVKHKFNIGDKVYLDNDETELVITGRCVLIDGFWSKNPGYYVNPIAPSIKTESIDGGVSEHRLKLVPGQPGICGQQKMKNQVNIRVAQPFDFSKVGVGEVASLEAAGGLYRPLDIAQPGGVFSPATTSLGPPPAAPVMAKNTARAPVKYRFKIGMHAVPKSSPWHNGAKTSYLVLDVDHVSGHEVIQIERAPGVFVWISASEFQDPEVPTLKKHQHQVGDIVLCGDGDEATQFYGQEFLVLESSPASDQIRLKPMDRDLATMWDYGYRSAAGYTFLRKAHV